MPDNSQLDKAESKSLAPCPFCGGAGERWTRLHKDDRAADGSDDCVTCTTCNATAHSVAKWSARVSSSLAKPILDKDGFPVIDSATWNAAIDRCVAALNERVDSLVIMQDRAGYTREGSDLGQRLFATREAVSTVGSLKSAASPAATETTHLEKLARRLDDANAAAAFYVRDEPNITPRRAIERQAAEIERLKRELADEREKVTALAESRVNWMRRAGVPSAKPHCVVTDAGCNQDCPDALQCAKLAESPSATTLKDFAERCRPAVKRYVTKAEQSVLACRRGELPSHYLSTLQEDSIRADKLLEEIDAIIAGSPDTSPTTTRGIKLSELIAKMNDCVLDTDAAGRPEASLVDTWTALLGALSTPKEHVADCDAPDGGPCTCAQESAATSSATVTTDFEAMLNWLGNHVLACDYGDNDRPGEIGWRIRHDLLRGPNGERQPAFMYGKSFGEAIRAEIAKVKP